MDTNNNHSDCGFGERLVSYIYDESGAGERTAVETHLGNCAVCADELAALTGIHFAVSDWKRTEFDVLQTPAISIPSAPADASRQARPDATGTWLSALRNLFTLSPAWSLTAASFAVFMLVGAVVLFVGSNRGGDEVAGGGNLLPTPIPSASRRVVAQQTPEPVVPAQKTDAPPKPVVNQQAEPTKATSVKSTVRPVARNGAQDGTKKPAGRQPKPARDSDTTLTDEEEDDSLRLAELFDEIGMR